MEATDSPTLAPPKHLKSPETLDVVEVRRKIVTTRISAKPPSSPGSSSICTSATPSSGTTGFVSDNSSSQANKNKPSYMSMTEATKAKRRTNSVLRQSMDEEFQFMKSSRVLDPSYISFSKPLGVPTKQRE